MRSNVKRFLGRVANWLELVVGAILIIVLAIYAVKFFTMIFQEGFYTNIETYINTYLGIALNIAVGVEFVKMLCKHTPETIIEVLLFATARTLVISHSEIYVTLMGVIAIAILFGTRKYLFCAFDNTEIRIYRGSVRVDTVNKLEHINLPTDIGDTLRDCLVGQLESEGRQPNIGTCVYFPGVALRVDHMKEHLVTRVEIIKEI